MSVTFELPTDVEQNLRREFGDLDCAAKEAALVEMYRQRRITQHEFCRALGISRIQADGVLKRHHVIEDLPTDEEQGQALDRLGVGQDK